MSSNLSSPMLTMLGAGALSALSIGIQVAMNARGRKKQVGDRWAPTTHPHGGKPRVAGVHEVHSHPLLRLVSSSCRPLCPRMWSACWPRRRRCMPPSRSSAMATQGSSRQPRGPRRCPWRQCCRWLGGEMIPLLWKQGAGSTISRAVPSSESAAAV